MLVTSLMLYRRLWDSVLSNGVTQGPPAASRRTCCRHKSWTGHRQVQHHTANLLYEMGRSTTTTTTTTTDLLHYRWGGQTCYTTDGQVRPATLQTDRSDLLHYRRTGQTCYTTDGQVRPVTLQMDRLDLLHCR